MTEDFRKSRNELGEYIKGTLNRCVEPGVYVCNYATGTGKSYTISNMVCDDFIRKFERVIIFSPQVKLVEEMYHAIINNAAKESSHLRPKEVLWIKKNSDALADAILSGKLPMLLNELQKNASDINKESFPKVCRYLNNIERIINKLTRYERKLREIHNETDFEKRQELEFSLNFEQIISDDESALKRNLKNLLKAYASSRSTEKTKKSGTKHKRVKTEEILKRFPTLVSLFPTCNLKKYKVWLTTIHKGIYGISTIIGETLKFQDIAKDRHSLIIFDESDAVSQYMRSAMIEKEIEATNESLQGYDGLLCYSRLINENTLNITDAYDDPENGIVLADTITSTKEKISDEWQKRLNSDVMLRDIFVSPEQLSSFRPVSGVFFSGNSCRINTAPHKGSPKVYICYNDNDKQYTRVSSTNVSELKSRFDHVIDLSKFLYAATTCKSMIQYHFAKLIRNRLGSRQKEFQSAVFAEPDNNVFGEYFSYPTLHSEVYTMLRNIENKGDSLKALCSDMSHFIENRRNNTYTDNESNRGDGRIKTSSVHEHGFQHFIEQLDEHDNLDRITFKTRSLSGTPEKLIIDFFRDRSNTSESSSSGYSRKAKEPTIILCSATASSQTIRSNFDLPFLKQKLGKKFHTLTSADAETINRLHHSLYPAGHNIETTALPSWQATTQEGIERIPERLLQLFHPSTAESNIADRWYYESILGKLQDEHTDSNGTPDVQSICFYLSRFIQFAEVYHKFHHNPDIRSLLYFQNQLADKYSDIYQQIACLIDGSYASQGPNCKKWENNSITYTKYMDEMTNNILPALSSGAKKLMIAAYNSFKAGSNLQYPAPKDIECLANDVPADASSFLKDWDAVYLETPTRFISKTESSNYKESERSIHEIILFLTRYMEMELISKEQLAQEIYKLISTPNYNWSEKKSDEIFREKSIWIQGIIEQAVGRICRTYNKPQTTHILYDQELTKYFYDVDFNKSMTKEYSLLAKEMHAANQPNISDVDSEALSTLAKTHKETILSNALQAQTEIYREYEESGIIIEPEMHDNNLSAQSQFQDFKRFIITHPTLTKEKYSLLNDNRSPLIRYSYGEYKMDGEEVFDYEREQRIYRFTPQHTKLDILMKNVDIRNHFVRNGFAIDWKDGTHALHPEMFASEYAGEIGEEAFVALAVKHLDIQEDSLQQLSGKEYEFADFIYTRSDGSRIAFDIKNLKPSNSHHLNPYDIDIETKRKVKRLVLGCPVITINIIQLEHRTKDALREIDGLITTDGHIIPEAIARLRSMIHNNEINN